MRIVYFYLLLEHLENFSKYMEPSVHRYLTGVFAEVSPGENIINRHELSLNCFFRL